MAINPDIRDLPGEVYPEQEKWLLEEIDIIRENLSAVSPDSSLPGQACVE